MYRSPDLALLVNRSVEWVYRHRAISNSGPPPLPLGLRFDALDRSTILRADSVYIYYSSKQKFQINIQIKKNRKVFHLP